MLISRQRGANLTEMMVGLAIIAILLMAGVPAFNGFLNSQRVRSTADHLSSGLQLARAEAVKRNILVEFVLTDDDPIAAGVSSVTPSVTGRNWIVRAANPATGFFEFIEGHAGVVGSGAADTTPVVVTATEAKIAYNGFGTAMISGPSTFSVTNPAGGACIAESGAVRCLNVIASPGGQVRMCDPDPGLNATDTRKC